MSVQCRVCSDRIEGSLHGKCEGCGAEFRLSLTTQVALIAISGISAALGFSLLFSKLNLFVQVIGCLILVAVDIFLSVRLAARALKFWRCAPRAPWEAA